MTDKNTLSLNECICPKNPGGILRCNFINCEPHCAECNRIIRQHTAAPDVLREALSFYADFMNHAQIEKPSCATRVMSDGGEIARKALAGVGYPVKMPCHTAAPDVVERVKRELSRAFYYDNQTDWAKAIIAAMGEICKTDCKIVEPVAELVSSEIPYNNERLVKIAQFIHDRMIHVHGENKNVDYLHGMRDVIKYLSTREPVSGDSLPNGNISSKNDKKEQNVTEREYRQPDDCCPLERLVCAAEFALEQSDNEHVQEYLKSALDEFKARPIKREIGAPFLKDRADGVRGRYVIARIKDGLGTHEYWNKGNKWGAFGEIVLDLTKPDYKPETPEQIKAHDDYREAVAKTFTPYGNKS